MKFEIPTPLNINWTCKSVDSARSGIETLPDGRLRCWIDHELLKGITPKMLVWWFSHLEGDVEINGRSYNRYRVWHPQDHLFIEYAKRNADGSVGVGSVIHLAEMLNGQPKYLVHTYSTIMKLDEEGYIHRPSLHGLRIVQMDYSFEACDEGTIYRNSLTIGVKGLLGKLLNPLIRRFMFDDAHAAAWIRHNIEEVGNFESFLPALYRKEARPGLVKSARRNVIPMRATLRLT